MFLELKDFLLELDRLARIPLCERLSSPVNFEPLNVFTNLAFLIGAFLGLRLLKQNNLKKSELKYLPILMILIGFGSFLYHSMPNLLTITLDITPIIAFTTFAIYLMLVKLTGSRQLSVAVMGIYVPIQVGLSFIRGPHRNIFSLMTVVVLLPWCFRKFGKTSLNLLLIFLIYSTSILIGANDTKLCPYFHLGTHFIWHLLTATTAYLTLRFLVKLEFSAKKKKW